MIYETYTCSLANGLIEYGYTFKVGEGDDCLFDLVLGVTDTTAADEARAALDDAWSKYEWAAKAVVAAAP